MTNQEREWTIPDFTARVIDRAQNVLDEFGEWGDQHTELGIIRKARFAIPKQEATFKAINDFWHQEIDEDQVHAFLFQKVQF